MNKYHTTNEEKIKYIKEHYPNLSKINPYIDRTAVLEIKDLLCDMGFYKNKAYYIPDLSIINIILKAQGKKKEYLRTTKRNKRG